MDSKNKNQHPSLGAVSKITMPFYEPPPRKTSTDIINEARAAIRESQMADTSFASTSVKPLNTQRPFTPREKERILFGKKTKSNRPPSSFSLRYLQTEAEINAPATVCEAGPVLTPNIISNLNKKVHIKKRLYLKSQRSNSVTDISNNKIFDLGVKELSVQKIKLPALESVKPLQKRKLYKNTFSLDNLPEECELPEQPPKNIEVRNAFSSPQERTDFNQNVKNSPFGRPSKQQSLSQCLLLGPQNLDKLFENKLIIENSETLFIKSDAARSPKQKTVMDVMESLNAEASKNDNEEVVITLLIELYECMEKENLLNNNITSKMKIHILKCLYKYVESQNEHLLLNIARIILALNVIGNNLSGVCKLIFKVSKNDKNDHLFMQGNVLELFVDALGRCSPLDDAEACVYGYGSVKFLTMNQNLLKNIIDLGVLQLMVLHIKIVNNAKAESISIPEQTSHALFQLTGALRNLATDEELYDDFISSNAIFQLCQTINMFTSDIDIVSNVSRTLSTISTYDNCCDTIAEYPNIYKIFVKLFIKYPGNEEIIVRLAYTLGNLVAKLDNARISFYQEKDSVKCLLNLWQIYLERTLKNCSLRIDSNDENGSNTEDVMIKIIRVIANTAIDTEIGKVMNEHYGIQLIDEFLKVLISNPFKRNDELVLSVLSTLNNLSYYYTADFDQDIFHIKQVDITEAITEYINSKNKECVVEAIRILGNLSRSNITRSYITETEIFKSLINKLVKDDVNLLRTTVGVFVNLMADNRNRLLFKNFGGITKLIKILNKYGQYDWPLGMLVCQVIWNFCIETINLYDLITDDEIQDLLSVLADCLDEEKLFGITNSTENLDVYETQEYIIWEEFANVATNVLEKIEHFLDTLEQLQLAAENKMQHNKTKDSSTNISFAAW